MFWIELNLSTGTNLPILDALPAPAVVTQASDPLPRRTLLYVEDNPANLMLVEDIVTRRPDIRLLSARDGPDGIAMARASRPDVILMDIHLPGISGLDALRILQADPLTARIPVMALSANAGPRDKLKGLEAGFFDYHTKPINVAAFLLSLDLAFADAIGRSAGNESEGGPQ